MTRPKEQLCLFCGEPYEGSLGEHLPHCDGHQGRREAVNALRDEALEQVAENAEETSPGFFELARAFVVDYLRHHGPTPGEVLSLACKRAGIRPHDDRAFGPVYMHLVRRGAIVKAGSVRRERGHGTAGGNVWRLAS